MAVPQPTDARTPCPVCRAPIHPIAGRCKHCKTDLAALRQVRPAAGTALPPLAATPARPAPQVVVPVAAPASTYGANGMVTITDEPSQPILPPRPTGRMAAAGSATVSRRPAWKRWPVIVIMLATIAIVAAVVLMAFPPGGAAADTGTPGGKRGLEPPPAPEHMDQNPLVPGAPHSQVTPPTPSPVDPLPTPRHTPDPLPVDPDPDPFSGLGRQGGLGRGLKSPFGGGANGIGMFSQLLKHACDRFKQCGNIDDTLRMTCDMTLRSIPQQPAPTCPAAQRCLDKVDQMSCSASGDDMTALLGVATSLQDCMDAMSC